MTTWKKVTMEQSPSHSFELEKTLEGVLVAKQENVGPNNSFLFTVEKKGGKKVAVWGSAVLNKLNTLPIGSLIKIEYLGKKKGKRGTEFRDYDIQVDEDTRPASADEADDIMNG
jgi:hypothetical protein